MFEFFKNKLKEVVSKFSKKVDEEAKPVEEPEEETPKAPAEKPKAEPPKPAEKEKPKKEAEKPAEAKPKPVTEAKPEPKPEEALAPIPKEQKVAAAKPEPAPAPKEPKPTIETTAKPEPKQPVSEPVEKPDAEPAPEALKKAEEKAAELVKEIKEELEELEQEQPKPAEKEKKGIFGFLKKEHKKEAEAEKPKKSDEEKPTPKAKPAAEHAAPEPKAPEPKRVEADKEELQPEPEKEAPKNLFSIIKEKITKKELSEKQFEELFWDLEMMLMESNVAIEVIDKIKEDLKENLVDRPLERGKIEHIIESTLKHTIEDLFKVEGINLLERVKTKKPYIICFVGINGSGKTTTIAKLAHLFKQHGLTSVIAASDTFRAAAIQQLEEHANRLGIKLIKHDYGADSAAVAFDAISHAKAHNLDVVLIDTAGRLQSNTNLMDELKKVRRVTNPDLVLFVGESITGNDCVEQAKTFDQQIGIDGIILSKSDIDEKGGAAVSVSYVTKKPILYLGTGQGYDDLIEFNPDIIVRSLGLES